MFIWMLGAALAFLILAKFKEELTDMYINKDELSRLNYEKYGDTIIFLTITIASLLWPVLLIILILNLFSANS